MPTTGPDVLKNKAEIVLVMGALVRLQLLILQRPWMVSVHVVCLAIMPLIRSIRFLASLCIEKDRCVVGGSSLRHPLDAPIQL